MLGEFVISSVLSCCSKNLKWRRDQCYSSVLQLSFIWQAKEYTSPRHEGETESESEVVPSRPTLYDLIDCSLRCSSIHGIFQARVLEWVTISFSTQSSRLRDRTQVSHIVERHFTVWATRQEGRSTQKTWREAPCSILAPLFICFFLLPLSLLTGYVNWASQESCLFYLRFSLWSWTFLCSIFPGFSLFFLLVTAILDSFYLL